MKTHCRECGSQTCNHGNCPQCRPCQHCDGGDRSDKFFGYDRDGYEITRESDRYEDGTLR